MPRKPTGPVPHPADDLRDPQSLAVLLHRFLAAHTVANASPRTLASRRLQLRVFIAWAATRDLARGIEITRQHLEAYQRHLHHTLTVDGHPRSVYTQHTYLVTLRSFFHWLTKQHYLPSNPASELTLPKLGSTLPVVITSSEAEQILSQMDLSTPLGLRDRAMLETFYSSGIRRAELCGLLVQDVDASRGTLFIRHGKGNKARMVPIGERALAWISKYVDDGRPELVGDTDDGTLFLMHDGRPLTPDAASQRTRFYLRRAKIGKHGACHLFRHAMATLMLEHGADTRIIQAILGHERLTSTQIYTHVAIDHLKAVHTATHPAARLRRSSTTKDTESEDDLVSLDEADS
ncbi:MAG: site-specific tyrosine recombinase XerC [Deltaproteobacteria bacterium]|nr:site-specific tyrosine recombinase XerC [Deltaproteobacteria bacterium]